MKNSEVLNIASLLKGSLANGPGLRDVIWLQGCSIECPGCFNEHMWDHNPRHLIKVDDLFEKLKTRIGIIEGITISGGDPVEQAPALSKLLKQCRTIGLSTMVYTGYNLEALNRLDNSYINELLTYTDLLIDGPYLQKRRTLNLRWRGSTNQRVHFLSGRYSKGILEADLPNEEMFVFVDNDKHTTVRTGIGDLD